MAVKLENMSLGWTVQGVMVIRLTHHLLLIHFVFKFCLLSIERKYEYEWREWCRHSLGWRGKTLRYGRDGKRGIMQNNGEL